MISKDLIEDLRDYRDWAEVNSFEVPIDLPDVFSDAADTIENMGKHIEVLRQEVENWRKRATTLADIVVELLKEEN